MKFYFDLESIFIVSSPQFVCVGVLVEFQKGRGNILTLPDPVVQGCGRRSVQYGTVTTR